MDLFFFWVPKIRQFCLFFLPKSLTVITCFTFLNCFENWLWNYVVILIKSPYTYFWNFVPIFETSIQVQEHFTGSDHLLAVLLFLFWYIRLITNHFRPCSICCANTFRRIRFSRIRFNDMVNMFHKRYIYYCFGAVSHFYLFVLFSATVPPFLLLENLSRPCWKFWNFVVAFIYILAC